MPAYRNIDGDSGIVAYEYGDDWIEVEFGSGQYTIYRYEAASIGASSLAEMKQLADAGNGLNSFINRNVRDGYSSRR